MKPFRIGKIAYTNILPIYHYLEKEDLPVEWVQQVPTQLNQGMANGTIDIGPISSFAYAEQFPKYLLFPDLSISSWGAVRSIYLFSRKPKLSQLDGRIIACTTTSATSVNLLRILLEEFEEIKPIYRSMSPNLSKMMERADAALLIGDDAVKASWQKHDYYCFDLGYEWYIRTGLSMTFAVWAISNEIVEERKEDVDHLLRAFLVAKNKGMRDLMPVIRSAQRKLGGSVSFWTGYYQGLCYDLGEKEVLGLKLFYNYAFKLGLLSKEVEVQMLDVSSSHMQ